MFIRGWRIFYRNVFYFFVFVDGKVIGIVYDFLFFYEKRLVGSFTVIFCFQIFKSCDDIRNIVFFDFGTFVIQAASIRPQYKKVNIK